MKKLLYLVMLFAVSAVFLGCELKDDRDDECKKTFEAGIMTLPLACSDADYLAGNSFDDYDDCMAFNSQLVWIIFTDCKARKDRDDRSDK